MLGYQITGFNLPYSIYPQPLSANVYSDTTVDELIIIVAETSSLVFKSCFRIDLINAGDNDCIYQFVL